MNESDDIWPNTRRIRPYQQAVIMLLEVSSRIKSPILYFGDRSFSEFEVRWFSREVNQCAPIATRLRMVLAERVQMPTLFFLFLRLFKTNKLNYYYRIIKNNYLKYNFTQASLEIGATNTYGIGKHVEPVRDCRSINRVQNMLPVNFSPRISCKQY